MKATNIFLRSIVVIYALSYCTSCTPEPVESNQYTIVPIKFISNLPVISVKINDLYTDLTVDTGTTRVNAMLSKPVLNNSSAKYVGIIPNAYMVNYLSQKFPY